MPSTGTIRWREVSADREDELVEKGHRRRSFFPHRVVYLPRPGPDGYKLADWMCGPGDPSRLWEVVLFAGEEMLAEFPGDLFFDDDVVWHRQHFGRPGQVAYADVVIDGEEMWSMSHVSDLVQRIGRRRQHKTRIENRFKGWPDLLLNALLALADERGVRRLRVPTSALQMRFTDPARTVQPDLFERVYDRSVNRLLRATRDGDWWAVDVRANRDRLAVPVVREERLERRHTICLCHDVEAGLGHRDVDEEFAARADRDFRANLSALLAAERAAGVRATYNVVGLLLGAVRPEVEAGGHCVAFHSYDHRAGDRSVDQLARCRGVDYRIKGYRAPRSELTPELADRPLLSHNFEWLASSAYSLGFDEPVLRNGLVRLPVHVDDFALHTGEVDLAGWLERVRRTVGEHDPAVVSLHDCYAQLWLEAYPGLLEELLGLGELRTLDEVAADVVLASSI